MEKEAIIKFLKEKKGYDEDDIAEFWEIYEQVDPNFEFTERDLDAFAWEGKYSNRRGFDELLRDFSKVLAEANEKTRKMLGEEEWKRITEGIEDNQINSENLEGTSKIESDLLKFLDTSGNKETRLTWENMDFKNYSLFENFYEFADGCSMLLDKWELYRQGATPSIKEALKERCLKDGYKIDDKNILVICVKSLAAYWVLYDNVIELVKMIEMYNELDYVKRNDWQMNTPEVEFDFEIKQAGQHWKEKLLKNS